MALALETIFYFIIWIVVPFMLVFLIWLLHSLSGHAEDRRHRSAMKAGYWAGIMLFIMSLVYQVSIFLQVGFPRNEIFQGFSMPLALGGALIVFIIFLGGRKVTPPVVSGLFVLTFTFLAFSSLIHYLFIRTYNDVLLSLILGGIFGFLTHFATSPTPLKDFLYGKHFLS